MKKLLLSFCIMLVLLPALLLSQTSGYKVSGMINIGGDGFWDYAAVNVPTHSLFVSHSDRVHVIDLNSNKIVGEITGLSGVHGIVFADEFGKGFISNGKSNKVTVFDLKNLKKVAEIQVTGKNPDAIVYDSFTKRVFTMNGRSSNVTVIDARTDKVIGTIELDGRPEFCVSNDKGLMFVNLEDKSQIEEFSPKTMKTIKKWSIAPGEGPSGLAIDVKHDILFSGCHNNLMVISNAKTGKVITTEPIGSRVDACAFDPETNYAFSSNGDGTLTIIHEISPKEFKAIDNIITQKSCRTMALDPTTQKIYLPGSLEGANNTKSFGLLIVEKK